MRLDLELERTKISHLQMLLANELGLTKANAITAHGTLLPSSPPTEQDILAALEQLLARLESPGIPRRRKPADAQGERCAWVIDGWAWSARPSWV